MAIKVKPLGKRVLVQPLEEKGCIIIPDTGKKGLKKETRQPWALTDMVIKEFISRH
jgi:hypothetical protein